MAVVLGVLLHQVHQDLPKSTPALAMDVGSSGPALLTGGAFMTGRLAPASAPVLLPVLPGLPVPAV